jgi:FkbM family methyltransferase
VITLEPNSLNFRTTQHNVGHLSNVTPLHLALWDHLSLLSIGPSIRGATSASLQVQEIDVENVDNVEQGNILSGVSVGFLLDAFYLPSFDYVKIDIEGSEKEVFERSAINELEWLPTTKLITVEIHEDVRPGAAGSVALALSSDNLFLKHEIGEYQVWENTRMVGSIKSSNIPKGG